MKKLRFIGFLPVVLLMSAYFLNAELPPFNLKYASIVVTAEDSLLYYLGEQRRREVTSLTQVSKHVINALIATEDRDFFKHDGISLKGLARAAIRTITGSTQGGSTITMQLARNLYLTNERTLSRKWTEMSLATELENKYTKNEILLLYLNTVYFGNGVYGIWSAAQEYYSKTPDKLTIPEAAMLVGLLQSPEGYNPTKHPEKAHRRRNIVLGNMQELKHITPEQASSLIKTSLNLKPRRVIARDYAEFVRREANQILSRSGKNVNEGIYKIYCTLDPVVQRAAEKASTDHFSRFPAAQKNAQMGLVSVVPGTGEIRAMIGANPFETKAGLNRAVNINRQAGSAFKPFLYALLLSKGYTLAHPLPDVPIVIDSCRPWQWKPENHEGGYTGKNVPMKLAIQESYNLPAANAIVSLTSPEETAQFAASLGIASQLPRTPSISLGACDVSPLEMASSFAVFASMGYYSKPYSIVKIVDKDNKTIYTAEPAPNAVLDSATCYLITDALASAVTQGTAKTIKRFYAGIAAGKTGTTQSYADAWFVGYAPELSTAIWVGYDSPAEKLRGNYKTGGSVCAPLWGRMMGEIAKQRKDFGKRDYPLPSNVMVMELCEDDGNPWYIDTDCQKAAKYPVNILLLK